MEAATLLDKAIQALRPGSEYTFNDADYDSINWVILEGEAPTNAEIKAEIIKIKEAEKVMAQERASKRAALLERLGITEEEARLLLS